MKITKDLLKKIISEELQNFSNMEEGDSSHSDYVYAIDDLLGLGYRISYDEDYDGKITKINNVARVNRAKETIKGSEFVPTQENDIEKFKELVIKALKKRGSQ